MGGEGGGDAYGGRSRSQPTNIILKLCPPPEQISSEKNSNFPAAAAAPLANLVVDSSRGGILGDGWRPIEGEEVAKELCRANGIDDDSAPQEIRPHSPNHQ